MFGWLRHSVIKYLSLPHIRPVRQYCLNTRSINRDSSKLNSSKIYHARMMSNGKGIYKVLVKTGDRKRAGTDANVRIVLHGENDNATQPTKLDKRFRDDFERGKLDDFLIKDDTYLEKIHKIELWRDNAGYSADWYVDTVEVQNSTTKETFYFPVYRWIKAHHHYEISHLDTSLPQFDPHRYQRKFELEDKRKFYELSPKVKGAPAQATPIACLRNINIYYFDKCVYIYDTVMGNCLARQTNDYIIYVRTGDKKFAGTDANVKIKLHSENGNVSDDIVLDESFRNEFESGAIDTFNVKNLHGFGAISKIEFWRDDQGIADGWYVDRILIENQKNHDLYPFPVYRWIKADYHYVIKVTDTSLPQFDPDRDQRHMELDDKKKAYELSIKGPGMPAQVKKIPEDEQFSFDYKWNIAKTKIHGIGTKRWSNDLFFGLQRISSMNHSIIKLCTEIPEKLGVTDDMLKPFLEGWNLKQVIEAKHLFIVDLEILKGLPCKSEELIMCSPIALFLVNGNNNLVPIAIQLFQEKADDNPVFLPTDPPYTWMMAKIWYNNADAHYHQALTHLGVTVVTHRNLSQSHPIFKLLAPHFLYLIAINTPSGKVLPGYHFRDDALLLYNAINNYVKKYVHLYYDTSEKISGDWELQKWVLELTKERQEKDGGCGLKGVPGNGKFENTDQIIQTLTCIIYTCSVGHAATNFPQYDEYAFPPNYPGLVRGVPPKNKSALTETDVLKCLPDKPTTLDIMVVTKILSGKGTNNLGDFEVQYVFDPPAKKIVDEFRQDIKEISRKIKERNKERNPPYTWLDPDIVPNSISI
ncbi:hypothetical protein KUTeg_025001 [Tegillarca granosa]|uniref:Uncharacterized protein n=1 Tax=Tegillarca granosa TaxID=220873 RepID=A0ABQ9E4L0_TEGGR|nr:hypothetical protein KUTeg_025001 [Tegillarca granosa]